jgi:hypothetical protein
MSSQRRWWTLVGVALATFMTFLDGRVRVSAPYEPMRSWSLSPPGPTHNTAPAS